MLNGYLQREGQKPGKPHTGTVTGGLEDHAEVKVFGPDGDEEHHPPPWLVLLGHGLCLFSPLSPPLSPGAFPPS